MTIGRLPRRWAWRAAALVPAYVLGTYFANWTVLVPIRAEAAVVLVATLVQPASGLILLALLAPLGDAIVPLLGAPPVRHAETLIVAFLAGWLSSMARDDETRAALPTAIAGAMWLFAGIIVASFVATAIAVHAESPGDLANVLWDARRAYLMTGDVVGLHAAVQLLEGMGLVAATAQITRGHPRRRFWLLLALVVSGVAAVAASALLAIGVAPAATLARQIAVGLPRYSAIHSDVNATASLYVLLIGVSLGVALSIRRTRGAWLAAAAILLAGLTLTGSGAAAIAMVVVVAAAAVRWTVSPGSRRRKIVGALALSVLVIGAIAFMRTARSASSLEMRAGFTQTSLRMIEARPGFGVGVGRYYSLSALVLSPRLSWLYTRENAHDYFLQTAAELGLSGLTVFVCLMGTALWPAITRAWHGRAEGLTGGCVAGVLAYLVTALSGHPFLVPETVIPFWIVIGLLVGLTVGSADRTLRPPWAAIAVAGALVLTAPLRAEPPRMHFSPADEGFGGPQADVAGRPFRTAGVISSVFVGPAVTAVEIPVRLTATNRDASTSVVAWVVPSSSRSETRVGHDWTTLRLPLPGAEILLHSQRIDLLVAQDQESRAATAPALDVGQIRIAEARP